MYNQAVLPVRININKNFPFRVALSSHSSEALPRRNAEQVVKEYLFEGLSNCRPSYLCWSDSSQQDQISSLARGWFHIPSLNISPSASYHLFTCQLFTGHFYAWYLSCLKCPVTPIHSQKAIWVPPVTWSFFFVLIYADIHSLNSLSILS